MKKTQRPTVLVSVAVLVCTSFVLLSAFAAAHGTRPRGAAGHVATDAPEASVARRAPAPLLTQTCPTPQPPPAGASVKTDGGIYQEPPPPALPPAGCKFFDPTFGTEIMRVTDENDGQSNGTYYSYWPTFNQDNTRLIVRRSGNDKGDAIYDFDPNTFTLGQAREIPRAPDPGHTLDAQSAIWSTGTAPGDATKLYGFTTNNKLLVLDTSGQTLSYLSPAVADFGSQLGAGEGLWQMSSSEGNGMFAFTIIKAGKNVGFLVYNRTTGQVVMKVYSSDYDAQHGTPDANDLNEVQLDKSGRYLVVATNSISRPGYVIDLQDANLPFRPIVLSPTGHADLGSGFSFGIDTNANHLVRRSLATLTPETAHYLGSYYQNLHISMRDANDDWALVGFYNSYEPLPGRGKFQRELVLFKTDPADPDPTHPPQFRRLLHHHSVWGFPPGNVTNYWYSPRANVSRDLRFVAFSSNWGATDLNSRVDLFIARIDGATNAPPTSGPPDPTSGDLNGWSERSINEGKTGAASYSGGTFTVNGSGSTVSGGSGSGGDGLHFVYKELPDPGEVVARVSSLDFGITTSQAGVMVRTDLTNTASSCAFLAVTRSSPNMEFKYRLQANDNMTGVSTSSAVQSFWMKIKREGNQFSAFRQDGPDWVQVGATQTLEVSGPVSAGIAVVSGDNATLRQATFENVYAGPPLSSAPPAAPTNLRLETYNISCGGECIEAGQRLRWVDNASNETAYKLESRHLFNGQWSLWAEEATFGPNTEVADYLTCLPTIYRVRALNGQIGSPYSNEVYVYPNAACSYSSGEPAGCTPPSSLVVSKFRFGGPAGSHDEFVELYNTSDSPVTICTSDRSGGWTLAARSADGSFTTPVFGVPYGTVIPARGRYRGVNVATGGYTGGGGDAVFNGDIEENSGVALFKTANPTNFNSTYRADAVGFGGTSGALADLYREGSGLSQAPTPSGQYYYARKVPQDTGNNSADFFLVTEATWTNLVNASASGGTLVKTGGYEAGAISQQQFTGADGYVEFTVSSGRRMFVGLGGDTSADTSYVNIGYMLNFWGNGDYDIREGWTNWRGGGNYASGDVFRIAIEGGVVKYYKNGSLLYTSNVTPSYPLVLDTSLIPDGATVSAMITSPPQWAEQDIGPVGPAGSFGESNGTFTVSASGSGIWTGTDGFHYVYQQLSGDGEIIARVASIQNVGPTPKAGVMMRQSLDAGSRDVVMDVVNPWGIEFIYRPTADDNTLYSGGTGGTAPYWVRLVRTGTTFSAYYKANAGDSWSLAGTQTVDMPGTIYVGLSMTSHSTQQLCTATLDNVTIIRH